MRFLRLNRMGKKKEEKFIVGATKIVTWCFVASMLVFVSCGKIGRKDDLLLASVGDKRLYFSEMRSIFPKGTSTEDSLTLAGMYIDNWVKTRLLLNRAELNLTADELNVSREIEMYRMSLLIYKYEDRLLQEKLDTIVLESEIVSYYESNKANFPAKEYFVRAAFFKFPKNTPNLWNVTRLIPSIRDDDLQTLTEFSRRYAVKYDFFDNEWIRWAIIERELPNEDLATRQMRQGGRIDQQDDDYLYFVHIREMRAHDDTAPLSFVRDKVKSIIINQRKLTFVSNLHRDIYNDALSRRQFEIYNINVNPK